MKSNTRQYRFLFLALACLSSVGNYFIMDSPALLKQQLIQHMTISQTQQQAELSYSLLYSVYSLPNIILPLISGIFIDSFGDSLMNLIFVLFIVSGQMCFCLGTQYGMINLMIFGRFLQGIGGESQQIAIQTMTVKWFAGNNLNFSQALEISFLRLAAILNAIITPILSTQYGMLTSFYFGGLVCFLSLSATIGVFYMDAKYESSNEKQGLQVSQIRVYWNNLDFKFKLLSYLTCTLYMSYLSFNMFISSIIIEDHLPSTNSIQINQEIAGRLMAVPFLISTIFSPVMGMYVDYYGNRINLLFLSIFLMITGYVTLLYIYPLFCMSMIGISLTIFSTVLWASTCFLVRSNILGMAIGIMTALQNLGTTIAPIVITTIKTHYLENKYIIYSFIFLAINSLYFLIILKCQDQKMRVSLNSHDQIQLLEQLNDNNNKNSQENIDQGDQENQEEQTKLLK